MSCSPFPSDEELQEMLANAPKGDGSVSTSGTYGSRWKPEVAVGTYIKYDVKTIVNFDPGRLQMPVACEAVFGTDRTKRTPCEVLQVHSPFGTVKVIFDISRAFCPPVLPTLIEDDNRFMTLPAVITAHNPMICPDSVTLVYQVEGEYNYSLLQPLKPEDVEILFPRPTIFLNTPVILESFDKDIAP
jgi:hypothetical protein